MSKLLPINSTELEHNIADAMHDGAQLPALDHEQLGDVIRALHDPDHCPADLLPYLAWATSVDYWREDWPEQTKRDVIKAAWRVHQIKGTRTALIAAIEAFGYRATIREWWDTGGAAGTFDVTVDVFGRSLSAETDSTIAAIVNVTKPASRHIARVRVSISTRAKTYSASAALCGDVITVYPYQNESIATTLSANAALALRSIDTTTIYPETA